MLRTKWSSPVTSLGPFDPHGTCKKWQKYKNKLRMRNTQLPKKHCCLWTSAMFSIFLGGWGRGATHWTTDMFIVSANIFRWSLSGQVWSYFSYYRPCLSCGGPCPGFCTCSKLLTGHYTSTLHLNIIPQPLYHFTSTIITIILHLNCFHLPHCPFSALGNAVPWSRCLYQVHRNDRAGIGWGGLQPWQNFQGNIFFSDTVGRLTPVNIKSKWGGKTPKNQKPHNAHCPVSLSD